MTKEDIKNKLKQACINTKLNTTYVIESAGVTHLFKVVEIKGNLIKLDAKSPYFKRNIELVNENNSPWLLLASLVPTLLFLTVFLYSILPAAAADTVTATIPAPADNFDYNVYWDSNQKQGFNYGAVAKTAAIIISIGFALYYFFPDPSFLEIPCRVSNLEKTNVILADTLLNQNLHTRYLVDTFLSNENNLTLENKLLERSYSSKYITNTVPFLSREFSSTLFYDFERQLSNISTSSGLWSMTSEFLPYKEPPLCLRRALTSYID